ncbi:MAG: hypothetical protein Q9178_005337 [Gyalolechia marmorata]
MATDDGSEDINDFLLRIRELGDRRDREDEERTRKLEEEILQGRKERQARRAERARSISPTKEHSNGGTPTSIRSTAESTTHEDITRSPVTFQPPPASLQQETKGDQARVSYEEPSKRRRPSPPQDLPQPPSKPAALTTTPPSTAMTPSRAGTLSWQQRPTSRGSVGQRARPLSQFAAENASRSPRASVEPPSAMERELSKDEIAESLGSKDPTWFRQTQERGLGSAAYRRNQDESLSDTLSITGSMRLPGMSREPTAEPERQGSPTSESIRSLSPSRGGSIKNNSFRPSKHSTSASLSSFSSIRSPLPIMNSHIFEPPVSEPTTSGDKNPVSNGPMPVSVSQGRISPERLERSPSPTKGLGGFVQSAMLKRSDSVSKRWSAQPGTGLSRGNSIASNRSGYETSRYGIASLTATKEQPLIRSSRETSPVTSNGPDPSRSTVNLIRGGKENDRPGLTEVTEPTATTGSLTGNASKSSSPREDSRSEHGQDRPTRNRTKSETSPPSSPSKRWSPTKSSWLENAINKPDSSKPRMPPPQQPSWMANLNQAKHQRGATDPGKTSFKEVSTGGLLRSPPMGAINNPSSIRGLPSRPASGMSGIVSTDSFRSVSASNDEKRSSPPVVTGTASLPSPKPETTAGTTSSDQSPARTPSANITPSKPLKNSSVPESGEKKPASPHLSKPKPETPPKKDLRSNLKPRQVSGDRKPAEEAEFKNVFGKLKRTQTQNYVAPDELKDNILRGKAGLSVTGGPKKTERRDEFKESLLKQKEAMKAGAPPAVGRKPSADNTTKSQGIPKGAVLATGKPPANSDSTPKFPNPSINPTKPQTEALVGLQRLKEKSPPTTDSPLATLAVQENPPVNERKGLDFNSSLAGMLARGPSPLSSGDRFAPKAVPQPHGKVLGSTTDSVVQSPTEGPQLTHMTKARARGPKRRLPKSTETTEESSSQQNSKIVTDESSPSLSKNKSEPIPKIESPSTAKLDPEARPLTTISNNHRKPSQPQTPRKPSLNLEKTSIPNVHAVNTRTSPLEPTSTQPKSLPTTKTKSLSPEIERSRKPSSSVLSHSSKPSGMPREKAFDKESNDALSSRDVRNPADPRRQETPSPVKGAAAKWAGSVPGERSLPARRRSPIMLPTRKDEEVAMQDAGLRPKEEAPVGLGIDSSTQLFRTSAPPQHDLPTPPMDSPRSPPLPAKKPPSIANRIVSNGAMKGLGSEVEGSPIPQTSIATRLFAELFDESPNNDLQVNIDTPAVLSSRAPTSETNKIRTLRKQLWEVTAGGKLISVSSDQSHILFEESLYICHHVFGSLSGTRTTEVYLWCGDGVATSAVEDAQIFARKEAKDHGGKLIVLAQGKETANFFQALGGIVITRHGQSDRASSRYMLCGRRHLGQIAFDEVDFAPGSLCKGFPYLISSGSGKIHLWKGSGSGVDELGCARLIGMDLGVRGEIEEVEDGREPNGFWDCFPGGRQQSLTGNHGSVSKHWQIKPSCEQYATRLYQIDIEAPRPKSSSGFMWGRRGSAPATEENAAFNAQIKEIAPFAQSDVFNDGVFVLDTFFEIFVILPSFPSTSTLLSTFRTALLFAQEYAILAASAHNENRPFVPVNSVVLFGVGRDSVPEGLRMAFRKWEGGKVRGCTVLGLAASIEATRPVRG